MGLDSILFLAFIFVAIGIVVWRLRSEEASEGSGSLDGSPEIFFVDSSGCGPAIDSSSHPTGCDSGAHSGGFTDCGGHH